MYIKLDFCSVVARSIVGLFSVTIALSYFMIAVFSFSILSIVLIVVVFLFF